MQFKFNELLTKYTLGSAMYIPLILLYYTCGLTWQNIKFERNVISLRQQIIYIANKGYFLSTPKTKSSVREIVMDKFIVEELKRWKNQQAENEVKISDSEIVNLVFTSSWKICTKKLHNYITYERKFKCTFV